MKKIVSIIIVVVSCSVFIAILSNMFHEGSVSKVSKEFEEPSLSSVLTEEELERLQPALIPEDDSKEFEIVELKGPSSACGGNYPLIRLGSKKRVELFDAVGNRNSFFNHSTKAVVLKITKWCAVIKPDTGKGITHLGESL